ncbi:hypothetical protein [Methyloceanibacter caenitepidi]|uniref:Uncharacterized protein n=1 Tax=Methyloceanibacter caenitepidi TaxID=1384459 RepID=A0A0A8K5S5_9HYPH|nr:hypothetical protein [Methyloceanibacter caenitepidi]BAQ18265.1 hypothetical protein GL4_2832 [Methyloceanibacter caenitepidi]
MPTWAKISAGLVLALILLGFAALKATSNKFGPLVQSQGTTYYGGDGPKIATVPCKTESDIRAAIARVHATFDHYGGASLEAFEKRAALEKGLPPLRIDTLYVITEDDKMRDGKSVLFIGLKADCVSTVFSFPARLYQELAAGRAGGV